MAFTRILCATDFSECARDALRVAAELARKSQATLVLLHVAERETHEARAELADWKKEARLRGAAEIVTKLEIGVVWDRIVEAARGDAKIDLIVIGSHGRSGRAVIGSVAERVLRDAPCTVMVVRPPRST